MPATSIVRHSQRDFDRLQYLALLATVLISGCSRAPQRTAESTVTVVQSVRLPDARNAVAPKVLTTIPNGSYPPTEKPRKAFVDPPLPSELRRENTRLLPLPGSSAGSKGSKGSTPTDPGIPD